MTQLALVPYHDRPPLSDDEREDGIGTRPCAGSYRPPEPRTKEDQ